MTNLLKALVGKQSKGKNGRAAHFQLRESLFQREVIGIHPYKAIYLSRGTDERGEKIPEWADDPTTMDDMIELRGFEEPTKSLLCRLFVII